MGESKHCHQEEDRGYLYISHKVHLILLFSSFPFIYFIYIFPHEKNRVELTL